MREPISGRPLAMTNLWPWFVLVGLGALHGINPGMGWLFAVCLGLQERRRMAVLAALPPIALGHAFRSAAWFALIAVLRANLDPRLLQYARAALLIGYGGYRAVRSRHPRWVGMRVGFRDLTLWSFLMATAHGAGLMLIPVFLATTTGAAHAAMGHHGEAGDHASQDLPVVAGPGQLTAAVLVHTLAHLARGRVGGAAGLRKARPNDSENRLVQHRFRLGACPHCHRRDSGLGLILSRRNAATSTRDPCVTRPKKGAPASRRADRARAARDPWPRRCWAG